jgi:hypothetical protein
MPIRFIMIADLSHGEARHRCHDGAVEEAGEAFAAADWGVAEPWAACGSVGREWVSLSGLMN